MLKVIENHTICCKQLLWEETRITPLLFCPQGRIPFYDQYGVIRDVLQNHLTEVMTLLTMRLPTNLSNSEEVLQNKLHIFRSLLPLGKKQAVLGQYQAYKSEVQRELNGTEDHVNLTPTYAGKNKRFFFLNIITVVSLKTSAMFVYFSRLGIHR